MELDLVDEFRPRIDPLVDGRGKRLLPDDCTLRRFNS